MSIACASLYDDVVQEIGSGVQSERLSEAFVRAVNMALDELSIDADLATRHSHITGTGATISTLDDEYTFILYAGIVFYLRRMGWGSSDPRMRQFERVESADAWRLCKGQYIMAESNDNQATSTNDVWGLGDLTS